MVTHDPRAAAIADRILYLADGRIVEERAQRRGRDSRCDDSARARRMIRVALEGLLGRKLRPALTSLAIVMGVAMVSGTYVSPTRSTPASTRSSPASARARTRSSPGKAVFGGSQGNGSFLPTVPDSLLARVRALPSVSLADGRTTATATVRRPKRQGDRRSAARRASRSRSPTRSRPSIRWSSSRARGLRTPRSRSTGRPHSGSTSRSAT